MIRIVGKGRRTWEICGGAWGWVGRACGERSRLVRDTVVYAMYSYPWSRRNHCILVRLAPESFLERPRTRHDACHPFFIPHHHHPLGAYPQRSPQAAAVLAIACDRGALLYQTPLNSKPSWP